jgi:hypothetical protein
MSDRDSLDQPDIPGRPANANHAALWQQREADVKGRRQMTAQHEIEATRSLVNTSASAFFTGNYAQAEACAREANATYRKLGCKIGIAQSGAILSALTFLRGEFDTARTLLAEALAIVTKAGDGQMRQSWPFRCNNQIILDKLLEPKTNKPLDENAHRNQEKVVQAPEMPARIEGSG